MSVILNTIIPFQGAQERSGIVFHTEKGRSGHTGPSGGSGHQGPGGDDGRGDGQHGRDGNTGGRGADGTIGNPGKKPQTIQIFAIEAGAPEASSGKRWVKFSLNGAPQESAVSANQTILIQSVGGTGGGGGTGGRGGQGGTGGDGATGRRGADGTGRGNPDGQDGGRGGDGGDGGKGGRGGDGGRGGNGSKGGKIILAAEQPQLLLYFTGISEGGSAGYGGSCGSGGSGGHAGHGGSGGPGGRAAHWTETESRYENGEYKTYTVSKSGNNGNTGPRGSSGSTGPGGDEGSRGSGGYSGNSGKVIYRHISPIGAVLGEGALFEVRWMAPNGAMALNGRSFVLQGITLQNIGNIMLPAGGLVVIAPITAGVQVQASPPLIVPAIGAGATVTVPQGAVLTVSPGIPSIQLQVRLAFDGIIVPKSTVTFELQVNG